jgi:hypothetical protein
LIWALTCSEWEVYAGQIHVAAQPCPFETSYCGGDGAALSAPNFAQGCEQFNSLFISLLALQNLENVKSGFPSCRVPKQTPRKMLIPLLFLTVLHSSLPVAGAEQTGQNATTHTTVGWVSDTDNNRSTITLLYNCLFTIFLCTWSAMHLNVPGEKDTQLRTFLRKCKWMLVGLLAPEFVAIIAVTEWREASKLVRQVRINPTMARDDERS